MEAPEALSYDPFSPEAMSNPWPVYEAMRQRGGAHRLDRYNAWALPCFSDVWEVFSDLDAFSILDGPIFGKRTLEESHYHGAPPAPPLDPMPMFATLDPPVHTRLRQTIGGTLRPRPVAELDGRIRQLARARITRLRSAGRFDAREDYAGPVSAEAVCLVTGLPIENAGVVGELANASLRRADGRPGLPPEALQARSALDDVLLETVHERRRASSLGVGQAGGMIDALVAGEFEGRRLTDAEIVTQVGGVVAGGVETVPKVLAGGLLELWRSPDQRSAIGSDSPRCTIAFEEMIRFGGPLQWVGRTLRRDRVVAGVQMSAGERVLLLIASANRDEREFPDADRFRWDRPMARHLGFGQGHHFCIGAHLARLEGRILLEEILRAVPDYEIDETGIERPPSEFQVGYTRLPLIVT